MKDGKQGENDRKRKRKDKNGKKEMEDGRMYESMHGCKRKSKEERIEVRMRVREEMKEGKIDRIE